MVNYRFYDNDHPHQATPLQAEVAFVVHNELKFVESTYSTGSFRLVRIEKVERKIGLNVYYQVIKFVSGVQNERVYAVLIQKFSQIVQ